MEKFTFASEERIHSIIEGAEKKQVVGQFQRCRRLLRLRLSTCLKIHLPLPASDDGFESKGPEAVLPTEAAIQFETNQDFSEELQEGVFAPDKDCQKHVTVHPIAETPNKKVKRKITHEDVLEQQYKALIAKQENLQLRKRKLELEMFLLEQKLCSIPAQVSINLSP